MRLAIWLGVLVLLAGTGASQAARPPLCEDGRFLLPRDVRLAAGVQPVDAIVLQEGRVSVAPLGNSSKVKLRRTRAGTKVRAIWSKRSTLGAKLRLTGVIDPSCTSFDGALRAGKLDLRADVSATRSSCGDGVIDQALTEECEPPSSGRCGADCRIARCTPPACQCTAPEQECDGTCTDVTTDPDNCGDCGTVCPGSPHAPARCNAGTCVFACNEGFADCDEDERTGCETELSSDPENCGRCGIVCTGEAAACCDGQCVDTDSSAQHCGECAEKCSGDEACGAGTCFCPTTNEVCDGVCTDTQTAPRHCGDCATSCQGDEKCDAGTCFCPGTAELCDGVCAELASNPDHCGDCDVECRTGERCEDGTCLCPAETHTICDDTCVDLKRSRDHCGECGNSCGPGGVCVEGVCTCPEGRITCGNPPVCFDPTTSEKHCGECDEACPAGTECTATGCACDVSRDDRMVCDGECVNPFNDADYCGDCNTSCRPAGVCQNGQCLCLGDNIECGSPATCINPETSEKHCGGCGKECGARETCTPEGCICDTSRSDRLLCQDELCVNPTSDRSNCGGCGLVCEPTEICRNGDCTCPGTTVLCGEPGACVNTQTSEQHCGGCDQQCSPGEECQEGDCVEL